MTAKSFLGKKHSDETKLKISQANALSQLGERNSQYGTCWITLNGENKKIKKEEIDLYLIEGWQRGRYQPEVRGRPSPFKGNPGKKHTEKTKLKIKDSIKKRKILLSEEEIQQKIKIRKARNVAGVIAYRCRKRNATPPDSDLELIKKIYENCPQGYHVDHIIALASNGLHHQDNLQYLPISENCRKGKKDVYDKSLALNWKDFIY